MPRLAGVLVLISVALAVRPGGAGELAAPLSGKAQNAVVFDGDSLDLDGHHIQLAGIDAPELGQTCKHDGSGGEQSRCGLTAAYELRKRLQLDPRPLRCWPHGAAVDDAVVATCAAGEDDLALVLLESGYAWALPDAQVDYRLAEEKAKESRLGLWSLRGAQPAEWRLAMAKSDAPPSPARGCVIAGIVRSGGEKIYYGPLDADYGKASSHTAAAERWFCSEEEARAAGWRRPGERPPP